MNILIVRHKFKVGTLAFLVGMLAGTACGATRLLYWNIQDGMWDGQADNFNRFVGWVQKQAPDIWRPSDHRPILVDFDS